MSFTLDSFTDVLLLLLLAAALLAVAWLAIARPWRSDSIGLSDRWRISTALVRYEFWLELRNVNRRRRRDLIEELRANLHDATAQVGSRQAVKALGSLRRMSGETVETARTRPRWSTGFVAAAAIFIALFLIELMAAFAWMSGAEASGVARVQGALPFFPGSQATWNGNASGFSMDLELGWLTFATAALTFIVVGRPWVGLRRRSRVNPAAAEVTD
jgi:hypothetical protein